MADVEGGRIEVSQQVSATLFTRAVKAVRVLVACALEPPLTRVSVLLLKLSDSELRAKTDAFRVRLSSGEGEAALMAEAFATVREASRRVLGLRHFRCQLVGGAVLAAGKIAEMGTGEGKTLVATLPVYLYALRGDGVHMVTVNDYLARRDAEFVGRVYRFLGLTVGVIQRDDERDERREAYACDVTFVTNSEFGFDYLRDGMAANPSLLVMREPEPFNFCVVDEVDSVLVDEGRNPLIIANASEGSATRPAVAAMVAEALKLDEHYTVDRREMSAELTEEGNAVATALLAGRVDQNKPGALWESTAPWGLDVVTALRAKEHYIRDKQYIVRDGEVVIVDEYTGRLSPGRRWTDSLHVAVEAKEGVKVNDDQSFAASITYQDLFNLFGGRLCGMTGTASTERVEFFDVYGMDVVTVPPNQPRLREDWETSLCRSADVKLDEVVWEIFSEHCKGRPLLVGTQTVEESEAVARRLQALAHVPREKLVEYAQMMGAPPPSTGDAFEYVILNARPQYAEREADIVAQAGRQGAITISTNMAGRGTDILLGGNAEGLAKFELRRLLLPVALPNAPHATPPPLPSAPSGAELEDYLEESDEVLLGDAKTAVRALFNARLMAGINFAVGGGEEEEMNEVMGTQDDLLEDARGMLQAAIERAETDGRVSADGGAPDATASDPIAAAAYEAAVQACAVAFKALLRATTQMCAQDAKVVRRSGGLHVVGSSLSSSRRINNQLRGRSGRQGDPGSTHFYLCLSDDVFLSVPPQASDLLANILDNQSGGAGAIESPLVEKQILELLESLERFKYGIRKSMNKYWNVTEQQRARAYDLRRAILCEGELPRKRRIAEYFEMWCRQRVDAALLGDDARRRGSWDVVALRAFMAELHRVCRDGTFYMSVERDAPPENPADLDEDRLGDDGKYWHKMYFASSAVDALQELMDDPHSTEALIEQAARGGPLALPELQGRVRPPWSAAACESRAAGRAAEASRVGAGRAPAVLLAGYLGELAALAYEERIAFLLATRWIGSAPEMVEYEQIVITRQFDRCWQAFLLTAQRLQSRVSVAAAEGVEPLDVFKIETSRAFAGMLAAFRAGAARDLLLFKPTAHDPEAVVRRFNLYTSESGVEEEFEPVGSSAKDGKAASLRERQI